MMASMRDDLAVQLKRIKSLMPALREHEEAIHFLPEILEQWIKIQEAKLEKTTQSGILDASRDGGHKTILADRTIADLRSKIESLEIDNGVKDKRIQALVKTVEDQKGQISAITKTQSTGTKDDRNGADTFRDVKSKHDKLREQAEKISSLETDLKAMEKENARKDGTISSLKSELAAVKGKATENEKFEQLKDDFRAVLLNKDKEIEEMKNSLEEKEVQFKELQKSSAAIKQRDDDLIRDIEARNKMIEDQAKRLERLKEESKAALSSKEKEIEQIKSRLAFLSEKRVKQDQSKVEDTLSMNRQSKLEDDFHKFVDEARMDACERIQSFYRSHVQEEIDVHIYYPRLACLIFEAAYERMVGAKEASVEFCKEISRGMIQSAPDMSHQFTLNKKAGNPYFKVFFTINFGNQGSQYPTDVLDAVLLTLKETAHNCNLDSFAKDVEGIIWEKWQKWYREEQMGRCSPNYALLSDYLMVSYIHQCIRLAWRMVTQVPALKIEYQSQYLQKIHNKRGYHSSPYMRASGKSYAGQNPGEEIACYLWPGLLDGSGRLIRAGEVLCKMKK